MLTRIVFSLLLLVSGCSLYKQQEVGYASNLDLEPVLVQPKEDINVAGLVIAGAATMSIGLISLQDERGDINPAFPIIMASTGLILWSTAGIIALSSD